MIGINEYTQRELERKELESRLNELKDPLFFKDLGPQIIHVGQKIVRRDRLSGKITNSNFSNIDNAGAFYLLTTTLFDVTQGYKKIEQFNDLESVLVNQIQKVYPGNFLQMRTKKEKIISHYALFLSSLNGKYGNLIKKSGLLDNLKNSLNPNYEILSLNIKADEFKYEDKDMYSKELPNRKVIPTSNFLENVDLSDWKIFYIRLEDVVEKKKSNKEMLQNLIAKFEGQLDRQKELLKTYT